MECIAAESIDLQNATHCHASQQMEIHSVVFELLHADRQRHDE
jgi:hypothetical protein